MSGSSIATILAAALCSAPSAPATLGSGAVRSYDHGTPQAMAALPMYGKWGGGGAFELIEPQGSWDFDALSTSQRQSPAGCDNTIFNPPGEIFESFLWFPAAGNTHAPRIVSVPIAAACSTEVGGNAVFFDDPQFGGFHPGQVTMISSPEIFAASNGITTGSFVEVHFSMCAPEAMPGAQLQVRSKLRNLQNAIYYTQTDLFPIEPGYSEKVAHCQLATSSITRSIFFEIGVVNGPAPQAGQGPAVDNVRVGARKDGTAGYWKDTPDIHQEGATCQATAFANCLAWWALHGYPELGGEGRDAAERNEDLRLKLVESVHTQHKGDGGVTLYLKSKGVFEGQPPQGDRPQLTHRRYDDELATWTQLLAEWSENADVLLRIQWYRANGTLADPDAAHYLTVNSIEDGAEKKVHVANPWGESTHEPLAEDRDWVYDTLDITLLPGGRIRADNRDLEQNAAGVSDAEYLCVTSINVIKPVQAQAAPESHVELTDDQDAAPAAGTTLNYVITNSGNAAITFFTMNVDVPIESVTSPAGWTSSALPAPYPEGSGCGDQVGGTGVAWQTTGTGVAPGSSLSGFRITVGSEHPLLPASLVWFTRQVNGGGTFGLVTGPVLLDCPEDVNGDLQVGFADLLQILTNWGPCPPPCAADVDGDGGIGFPDLLLVLTSWGPCT